MRRQGQIAVNKMCNAVFDVLLQEDQRTAFPVSVEESVEHDSMQ